MDKSIEFWTVPMIAKSLGITRQAVRMSILQNRIQSEWVGNIRVLTPKALSELLKRRASNPLSQAQQKRRKREQELARKSREQARG